MRPSRVRADESGAVAVIAAVTLLTMVLMASYVIDLGFLRTDRMSSQTVADMAATAAMVGFNPATAGSAVDACESALGFAAQNLDTDASPIAVSGSCAGTFAGYSCPSALPDPADVVYTAGPYTITLVHPIRDSGARYDRFMSGQTAEAAFDGADCDRFGVEVTRTRDLFFSAGPSQTTRSAVAVTRLEADPEDYASLVVLHRGKCQALVASGTGTLVDVKGATYDSVYYPGVITVDTVHPNTLPVGDPFRLGSACSNNNEIIRMAGSGSVIKADPLGGIFSQQLLNDPTNSYVYSTSPAAPDPTPTGGGRNTRRSVDHLYNCLASYPTTERWSPTHSASVSIDSGPCEDAGTRPPYLKNLVDTYQGVGIGSTDWAVIGGTGAGVDYEDSNCNNMTGTYGPAHTKPAGKSGRLWFINCTGSQGFRPNGLTFEGVDAVVTYKKINTQGPFTIRGHATKGTVLYVQREGLANSNNLTFEDTFVYIHEGEVSNTGGVNTWYAPRREMTGCSPYNLAPSGAPPAACFAPLGLWTNAQAGHDLGGNGSYFIRGSYFAPNSDPFRVGGTGSQDFTRAQFFAGRLLASGGGTIEMITDPRYQVPSFSRSGGLIR